MEHDTLIIVAPAGNVLWTCDPEAIVQLSNQRRDFVKPVKMMEMLNIFGPTITATEGEESRLYRKIIAPSFNERTHEAVWRESMKQADDMMNMWKSKGSAITNLNGDLAQLTLHVISDVCFARHLEWTDKTGTKDHVPPGHSLTYKRAINLVLEKIAVLMITPPLVLKSLVKAGQPSQSSPMEAPLSSAAVLGNMFITIVAGHETSANTLTYALTLLACRPSMQRNLQADIDKILDSRPPGERQYNTKFAALLDGYAGAVMDEVLRLYTVIPFIPKATESQPQILRLKDRTYTVPARTLCLMNTSATHRNPKFWPVAERTADDGPPYPVSSFNPTIWLNGHSVANSEGGGLSPTPGSFIPFAEGPRSCIGKKFAQTQFVAVIATMFSKYSVELVVKDDPHIRSLEDKRQAWIEARRGAEKKLSTGVEFFLALKMSKDVPLRLVPRGEEQWADFE
ncbi:MAG: hypothetical protein Q9225_003277 [Loekoesia sp. 1 TL-2023]